MYKKATPLFLLCETPLHAGSGSDLGIVDLPIQRERHTDFPKIEASSLKGSIRESFESKIDSNNFSSIEDDDTKIHRVFGYDDGGITDEAKENLEKVFDDKKDFAGAVGFSDARILLFPVKSMKGVFAWITCPKVLHQLQSDLKYAEREEDSKMIPDFHGSDIAIVSTQSNLTLQGADTKVVLEEYTFDADGHSDIDKLGEWLAENAFAGLSDYWKDKVKKDIVILPDNDFKDFVNLSTEVITRTKIDNVTGTVADGALFTEEYLPSESLMYSLVLTAPEFRAQDAMSEEEVTAFVQENLPAVIQLGGNATLGKGLIRTNFLK